MSWTDDQLRAALERLIDAAGDEGARFILGEAGTPAARAELEHVIACRLAMKLLGANVERWAIRDRLVSRGMSKRTAYRVISEALHEGPRNCAKTPPDLAHRTASIRSTEPQDTPCR